MSTVIVALPSDDDVVNKVSSEIKAHMTILYLDDVYGEDTKHILEYVRHCMETMLTHSGLSVEKRGTLGPDDADVLFFDKGIAKRFFEFRSALLKDTTIKRVFDSVEQYPEWTPHLTLGYPEKPAKKLPPEKDYPITWVKFDRIAVWFDQDSGPEFELKKEELMAEPDLMMSDEKLSEFFAHYGIKGMKWGVRRSDRQLEKARGKLDGDSDSDTKSEGGSSGSGSSGSGEGRQIKSIADLTTPELQAYIQRIRLEQEYEKLVTPQPVQPSQTPQQQKVQKEVNQKQEKVDGFLKKTAVDVSQKVIRTQAERLALSAADHVVDQYLLKKGKHHLRKGYKTDLQKGEGKGKGKGTGKK